MCVDYIIGLATINTGIKRLVVRGLTVFGVVGIKMLMKAKHIKQHCWTRHTCAGLNYHLVTDAISDIRVIYYR